MYNSLAPQAEPASDHQAMATVLEIAGGYPLSRCLHVVADLGVADALDDSPRTVTALAEAVDANADALGRILRLLSAYGVFILRDGEYAHSPASRFLRSDHPQSLRALVRLFGLPISWATFGALAHTVHTGRPAGREVHHGGMRGRPRVTNATLPESRPSRPVMFPS
jgi:hypothetical protein